MARQIGDLPRASDWKAPEWLLSVRRRLPLNAHRGALQESKMTKISSQDPGPAWLRWAPSLAGAVLFVSLLLGSWAYLRDHKHAQAVERDRLLIVTTERLLSALKDVETGVRGSIITGRDNYLGAYDSGLAGAVPPDAARSCGPDRGRGADTLSSLVADRLKEAAEAIATYRQQGGRQPGRPAWTHAGRGKAADGAGSASKSPASSMGLTTA